MYKFLIVILKHILTVFSSPSSHPHLQLFLGVVSKPHLSVSVDEKFLFLVLSDIILVRKRTLKKALVFQRVVLLPNMVDLRCLKMQMTLVDWHM